MTKDGLVWMLLGIASLVAFWQQLIADLVLWWQNLMTRFILFGEALLNLMNLVVTSSPPFYFLGFGTGGVLLIGCAVFSYYYYYYRDR